MDLREEFLRIEKLVMLACNSGASEEEQRIAAVQACLLIQKHGLFNWMREICNSMHTMVLNLEKLYGIKLW